LNRLSYGDQIIRSGLLDCCIKPKSWLIARLQYRILGLFERTLAIPALAGLLARIARRLAGGYLYSVKIEVTTACNLKCKMCYVKRSDTELSFKVISSLLDSLRGCGVRIEILGGEPLVRKDIVEIVKYAKIRCKSPFVSLYTNGILANGSMTDALASAGLDAAIVSLISDRPHVQDEFTGKHGSWDQTINGIRCFLDSGIKVYTFTAIHSLNCNDYRSIYNFVKNDIHAHALFYQYIPQQKDDPLMIDPLQWQKIKHWVLMEKNRSHMEFVRNFCMLTGNACSGGNFVLTVKADGIIQPCPFINDIPMGNIYKQDIWAIYADRFRVSGVMAFKKLPRECSSCSLKSMCGGGCRAGNQALYTTYDRKDPRCLGPYSFAPNTHDVMEYIPSFF
jgi:radical SAM protein with 4Fe4S-binding SPASM domain